MRMMLGGLAALFAALAVATPAAAESIDCPLPSVRRSVTTTLPSGWFSTPVESRLTEARIDMIGAQAHMTCVYGEAARVMREVPSGQTCTPRSGGFECSTSGGAAPAPASEAHSSGAFNVRGTWHFDLDAGAESARAGAEFWYEVIRDGETYLTPRNGARYAVRSMSEPGYAGCTAATYVDARLRIESIPGRAWICVRTSEGRIGEFRIDGVDRFSSPRSMTITHTIWR